MELAISTPTLEVLYSKALQNYFREINYKKRFKVIVTDFLNQTFYIRPNILYCFILTFLLGFGTSISNYQLSIKWSWSYDTECNFNTESELWVMLCHTHRHTHTFKSISIFTLRICTNCYHFSKCFNALIMICHLSPK